MSAQSAPLSKAQLEFLRVLARDVSDEDILAIKRLIVRYFAEKLTQQADIWWQQQGLKPEDTDKLLLWHQRTPYKSNKPPL